MDQKERKKRAAAMAAVALFMDEGAGTDALSSEPGMAAVPKQPVQASPWALYGRAFSMSMRIHWQTRIYK